MYFELVKHLDIDSNVINSIIELKNNVWKYPYSSHKQWIDKNLTSEDVHLLLWDDKLLIGYLNLVRLKLPIDAWGIGNVVVSPTRHGEKLGLLLMNLCDYYLALTHKPGILICKDNLIGFYTRCGWSLMKHDMLFENKIIPHNILHRNLDISLLETHKLDRLF